MTVRELMERLAACQPSAEVVVPCLGCGESEAQSTLIDERKYVVVMCKACAGEEQHVER